MNLEVDESIDEDIVCISDEDAKKLNISEGDLVLLKGASKSAVVRVCIKETESGKGLTNIDVFQTLSPFTRNVKISKLKEEVPKAKIFHLRILLDSVIEVARNETSLENLLGNYHSLLKGKILTRGQITRLESGIRLTALDWIPREGFAAKIDDSTEIFIDLGIHSADEIEYRNYQEQMEALKSKKIEKTMGKLLKCTKEFKGITLGELREYIEKAIGEKIDSSIVITNIDDCTPKKIAVLKYPKERQIIGRLMEISSGVDQDL
ncbi:MAG: hypothetical protein ACE5K4_00665 [Candidatus Hydrothermarchaeota archaeon]